MSKSNNIVCRTKMPEIKGKFDTYKKKMYAIQKITITYAVQRYDGLRLFLIHWSSKMANQLMKYDK